MPVKTKKLGTRNYNDLVLSLYNAKTAVFGAHPDKPKGDSDDGDGEGSGGDINSVQKESKKLRDTAILLWKQTKLELTYERSRFGNLGIMKSKKVVPGTSEMRRRWAKKKELEDPKGGTWLNRLFRKLLGKAWLKIKRGLKRLIGKRGIKAIRRLRRLLRKWRTIGKRFRRTIFRPFRQASRFIKSLPGKAFNAIAKKAKSAFTKKPAQKLLQSGAETASTKLLKSGTESGAKKLIQSGTKEIAEVGSKKIAKTGTKQLLKQFKLFYKAGPGKLLKRIPFIGAIADALINIFVFKEPVAKAVFMATGAGIGAWAGGIAAAAAGSVIPFLGTAVGGTLGAIAGGMIGDALGGLLYDVTIGKGKTEGAAEGAQIKKPQLIMVGEGKEDEYIVPKSRLGWFVAPLIADVVESAVEDVAEENKKDMESGDDTSEAIVQPEVTDRDAVGAQFTWKPGRSFSASAHVKGVEVASHKRETWTKQGTVASTMRGLDSSIHRMNYDYENPIEDRILTAKKELNMVDPEPEPNYEDILPSLANTVMIAQVSEPQVVPFPVGGSSAATKSSSFAVWGRKTEGN